MHFLVGKKINSYLHLRRVFYRSLFAFKKSSFLRKSAKFPFKKGVFGNFYLFQNSFCRKFESPAIGNFTKKNAGKKTKKVF